MPAASRAAPIAAGAMSQPDERAPRRRRRHRQQVCAVAATDLQHARRRHRGRVVPEHRDHGGHVIRMRHRMGDRVVRDGVVVRRDGRGGFGMRHWRATAGSVTLYGRDMLVRRGAAMRRRDLLPLAVVAIGCAGAPAQGDTIYRCNDGPGGALYQKGPVPVDARSRCRTRSWIPRRASAYNASSKRSIVARHFARPHSSRT